MSRKAVGLAVAITASLLPAAVASARPVHIEGQLRGSYTITSLCPFPIVSQWQEDVRVTLFFDDAGQIVRRERLGVRQEVFTANGKSLTSEPVRIHGRVDYDAATGQATTITSTGVLLRFLTPDGTRAIVAGRWVLPVSGGDDLLDRGGPDAGTMKNVDALCAALAA